MSGPIVRTGPTKQFSENWDSVFGKKSGGKSSAAKAAKPAKKAKAAKPAKKSSKKKKGGK